jgi:hypothetical protein
MRLLTRRFIFLVICFFLSNLCWTDSASSGIPQKASSAMNKARAWHSDAVLVSVEVTDYHTGNLILRFSFYSPSNSTGLWITGDSMLPVNGEVNWSKQPIPPDFIDLPPALTQAQKMGMQGAMDHATLQFWNGTLAWRIAPAFDPNMRVYDVPAGSNQNKPSPGSLEPWQTSWDEFAKVVQALYVRNAEEKEFIKVFNGKQVHWEGQVSSSEINEGQLDVVIDMPDKSVVLANGTAVHMNTIVMTISNTQVILSSKKVRFHVTLQKEAPKIEGFEFPAAAVHLLTNTDEKTGKSVTGIVIETENDGAIE